jgi:hypothetical protein
MSCQVVDTREEVKAARVRSRESATKPFLAACRVLFKAHPRWKSFSWRQYTPFFGGDSPCRFRVFCDEPVEEQLQGLVAEFLDGFSDEMEGMFGDHVRVTVYRDGTVETEQCEHD